VLKVTKMAKSHDKIPLTQICTRKHPKSLNWNY
jgi:hypothetical protein